MFTCPDALRPGRDLTKRYLLRLGVVLLGFRVPALTLHPQVKAAILQGDPFLFLMVTIALGLTTPLVGLRVRDRLLHDGRAATLRDAVLEHGGEGEIVRRRFFELDEHERQAVHSFIASL